MYFYRPTLLAHKLFESLLPLAFLMLFFVCASLPKGSFANLLQRLCVVVFFLLLCNGTKWTTLVMEPEETDIIASDYHL